LGNSPSTFNKLRNLQIADCGFRNLDIAVSFQPSGRAAEETELISTKAIKRRLWGHPLKGTCQEKKVFL
jgi:hypothetical protein